MDVSEPCIKLTNISVSFQEKKALDGIHLSIMPFEHTVFMGPNGSGKSTLLRVLSGELFPDNDDGMRVWHTPEGHTVSPIVARQYISLVSYGQLERYLQQRWNLTGELLVLTGYEDTPLLYHEPTDVQRAEVRALAMRLGIEPLLNRAIMSLPPAQLSLLLLARACITKPATLLLDELTDNLVADDRERVLAMLMEISQTTTLLAASHRMDTLPSCFARKFLMEDGCFIGEAMPCTVLATPLSNLQLEDDIVSEAPILFHVRDALVHVDNTSVLYDLSWRMREGEHWLVLGGHGSGKSSFLRFLAGELHAALGGSIRRYEYVKGQGGNHSEWQEIILREDLHRVVHFLSDTLQASYAYVLTGAELVASGIDNTIGLYRMITDAEWEQVHIRMQSFNVAHLAERTLDTLSTGQKRRLMLARALIGSPKILICDEPFTGLDVAARGALQEMFMQSMNNGVHFVISARDVLDLPSYFTHALIFDEGRIVHQGRIVQG